MVFRLFTARWRHGWQAVPDPTTATPDPSFRGFPEIAKAGSISADAVSFCPGAALSANPVAIDLGKCHLCGACARIANSPIRLTNRHHLGQTKRDALIVTAGTSFEEYHARAEKGRGEIQRLFGRSLKLRSVSAAGCSACEMELNATTNANFDMLRYGIDIVASPRHADAVVVTGPVSANMQGALEDTWAATPSPKLLILMGACAISGGLFAASPALDRRFLSDHTPDIYIPGCPPHPLTVVNAILHYLGRENGR